MMNNPHPELIKLMKHLARRAGEVMMKRFEGHYQIYDKPDGTRVTDVDLEISDILQETLAKEFPEAVLFSEECGTHEIIPGRPHLIIDELDGTSAFIEKRLGFSHQAAYFDPADGLTFGLIYHPWNDHLLSAFKGRGVSLEQGRDRYPLSSPDHPEFKAFRYAHPYRYRGKKYRRLLERIGVDSSQIVLTDSTRTHQFALGQIDASIMLMERIPEWDWAAEKLIVEELGFYHGYLNGEKARFGVEPPSDNPGYLICPMNLESALRASVLEAIESPERG